MLFRSTAVSGSPFTVGKVPVAVTLDPSGSFVYVANSSDNNISVFSITSTNTLTSVGTIASGTGPNSIVVTQ